MNKIEDLANEVSRSQEDARLWLQRPHSLLNGESPQRLWPHLKAPNA